MYYLKAYSLNKKGPNELLDINIASAYSKLSNLFELKNKNQNMEVLHAILKGEEIKASITPKFSFEKNFNEDDFKSLLFYMGLLTIDKETLDGTILKVPNYIIKALYFEYFYEKISKELGVI